MCDSPIETGLYYLQSRYYDPEICRFINADVLASIGQSVIGGNIYDVNDKLQRFMFNYQKGIREEYKGTTKDPFAKQRNRSYIMLLQ